MVAVAAASVCLLVCVLHYVCQIGSDSKEGEIMMTIYLVGCCVMAVIVYRTPPPKDDYPVVVAIATIILWPVAMAVGLYYSYKNRGGR